MLAPSRIAIYGAGGFAREVAWLLSGYESQALCRVVTYIDDNIEPGRLVNGKPVLSWRGFQEQHGQDTLIAIGIGSPQTRRRVAEKCTAAGYGFATLRHPSVEISPFNRCAPGSIVCCGSILTVNIDIGPHVHVNLDCTVGHDVVIGAFTTVSPGVHISGNVHIGEDVFIGTGANIINGRADQPLVIADGTVIGAGACVTRPTEPHCLYAGVPAELKKRYRRDPEGVPA